jgi:hypothetical protein
MTRHIWRQLCGVIATPLCCESALRVGSGSSEHCMRYHGRDTSGPVLGKQMGAGARLPLLIWAVAGLAGSTKFMSREVTPIVCTGSCWAGRQHEVHVA